MDAATQARDAEALRFRDWYNQAVERARAVEKQQQESLFGAEPLRSPEAIAAEQSGKDRQLGKALTGEFSAPLAPGRGGKVKKGPKPAESSLFGEPTEEPPQSGFDFQRRPTPFSSYWVDPKGKVIDVLDHADFAKKQTKLKESHPAQRALYDQGWVRVYGANVEASNFSATSKATFDKAVLTAVEAAKLNPPWLGDSITVDIAGHKTTVVPSADIGEFLNNPVKYVKRQGPIGPQSGFDFQREIKEKGLKLDQPFDYNDKSGSLERSKFRYYPGSDKLSARIYVDDTGAALVAGGVSAITGHSPVAVNGVAISPEAGAKILEVFRKGPQESISSKARANLDAFSSALQDAIVSNKHGAIIVRASTGTPLIDIRNVVRHEASHVAQYSVSGSREIPLFHYQTGIGKIPNYKIAAKALGKMGYAETSPETMIKEILSRGAERNYDPKTGKNELGLTPDQMRRTISSIIDKAVEVHQYKAYELLKHYAPAFRKAIILNEPIAKPKPNQLPATPQPPGAASLGATPGSP